MDRITKEQRSLTMSKIRSKNTKPELVLFKLLRTAGFKFRKHCNLPGKPDVKLTDHQVLIFVDGEFWHGKDFKEWKGNIDSFWFNKISDNIKRDRKNDRLLKKLGWKVIHLWGREIIKKPELILSGIRRIAEKSDLK